MKLKIFIKLNAICKLLGYKNIQSSMHICQRKILLYIRLSSNEESIKILLKFYNCEIPLVFILNVYKMHKRNIVHIVKDGILMVWTPPKVSFTPLNNIT